MQTMHKHTSIDDTSIPTYNNIVSFMNIVNNPSI